MTQMRVIFLLFCTFFPSIYLVFGQQNSNSYNAMWEIIQSDHVQPDSKLKYVEEYILKAQTEKNLLKEYQGLEKKSFLVSDAEALVITDRMLVIGQKVKNDSLVELALITKASFYYADRNFKEALNYSIKAEEYNIKTKNAYQLNSTRITIGNIYYHTRNYSKAAEYFSLTKDYYKNINDYRHKQGYVGSLYSLGKTYWKLQRNTDLKRVIDENQTAILLLTPNDQHLEFAYLNYVKGGSAYLDKEYSIAQNYFLKALPMIRENGDYTNEHLIYLYLGKILWQQGNKMEALKYFTKIDNFFDEKKFLNYELREVYNYLAANYRTNNDLEKQLFVTERLIALNNKFEQEQQTITHTLHYELETKKLKANRDALQKRIKSNRNIYSYLGILAIVLLMAAITYGLHQRRQKREYLLSYKRLMDVQPQKIAGKEAIEKPKIIQKVEPTVTFTVTEQKLFKALKLFEADKEYLQPLKIDDLVEKFNVGRTTLSNFFNSYKDGFNSYINKLRIDEAVDNLKKNNEIRRYNMEQLAELYGFNNSKTFTNQFKAITGITPAYFIKQLDQEDSEYR